MGPSFTLTDPVNSSPSTEFSVAPGKHGAIPARSLKVVQVSSTEVGTTNWWVSSTGPSSGGGGQHRSSGQHCRQVATISSVSVGVGWRVGPLVRRYRRLFDPALIHRAAGQRLFGGARPDR